MTLVLSVKSGQNDRITLVLSAKSGQNDRNYLVLSADIRDRRYYCTKIIRDRRYSVLKGCDIYMR